MKNTTFRKKALLSSVAMLLVALVALGSATFAWFTANPTVYADGLKMTTTVDAGLVGVSSTELAVYGKTADTLAANLWDHNIVLNAKDNGEGVPVADTDLISLTPVSGVGVPKYTVEAEYDNSYAPKENANVTESSAYYHEDLYLKTTDDSALANVYFTGITLAKHKDAGEIVNAIRVELCDASGNSFGIFGFDAVGNTYLTKEGDYEDALAVDDTLTDGVDESKYACATTVTKTSVGSLEKNGKLKLQVNVFLDGEDSECYALNAVNVGELLSSVQLVFSSK